MITHDLRELIFLADQVIVLSGRPARTQYVLDVTLRPRTLDDLYTPQSAEMLNILRHQIEIAQGRPGRKSTMSQSSRVLRPHHRHGRFLGFWEWLVWVNGWPKFKMAAPSDLLPASANWRLF